VAVSIARSEERCPQRRVTEPVASVQVRSGFDQQRSYICVLLLSSEVQRGESFLVREAHVVAVFIQIGGYVSYPALCGCVVQWRSSGSVSGGGHAVSIYQARSRPWGSVSSPSVGWVAVGPCRFSGGGHDPGFRLAA
jgi:hypothetical protein